MDKFRLTRIKVLLFDGPGFRVAWDADGQLIVYRQINSKRM